jgi:protein-S-isoprenylcysteine O-methyltransferase Ste14
VRFRLEVVWSAISLVLAAFSLDAAVERGQWADVAYFALHLQAAVLFLRRHPAILAPVSAAHCMVPLFAMLYVYAFDTSGSSVIGDGPLLVGCALCFASSYTLGRSYAVLPALRGLEVNGLYRVVRHPIYASYILMDAGIVLSTPTLRNLGVMIVGVVCTLWRIELEEEILMQDTRAMDYRTQVPFKLVPGLF